MSKSSETCDRCTHYTSSVFDDDNRGSCALMLDFNDNPHTIPAVDRAAGWDYGLYGAGVYVGPKFGCIHFDKKAKT